MALAAGAQNLSFEQVQQLRTKSLDQVDNFLSAKGWQMTDAEEATEHSMASATFGYKVDDFDSEKATSWFVYYKALLGNDYNRISIQVNSAEVYKLYLARLAVNGYKLKSSRIEEGRIVKVYRNATTTCTVSTFTTEGSYTRKTAYSFFFLKNIDYDVNFKEEG